MLERMMEAVHRYEGIMALFGAPIAHEDHAVFSARVLGPARYLRGDIATHPDRFNAPSGEAHYREARALAEFGHGLLDDAGEGGSRGA